MQTEPPADAFAAHYEAGKPQVVWTTLVADLETPVSAFLKIAGGRPLSVLFESVEGGAVRGRYSVSGLDPDVVWRTNGTRAEINRSIRSKPEAFTFCQEPPLEALRSLIAESRIALPEELPPMAADSCAASPTAVEAMKAVPCTLSSVGNGKSSPGTALAPFTWVRRPASQASTMATLAEAEVEETRERSSSKERRSGPSSTPPGPAWPEK